jgi:hypothetical protein
MIVNHSLATSADTKDHHLVLPSLHPQMTADTNSLISKFIQFAKECSLRALFGRPPISIKETDVKQH